VLKQAGIERRIILHANRRSAARNMVCQGNARGHRSGFLKIGLL